MRTIPSGLFKLAGLAALAFTLAAVAQDHQHTITTMRDHLLSLQEIDVARSRNAFDKAASNATFRQIDRGHLRQTCANRQTRRL